jgi:uncharacterized protein (TIGR02246 family)
MNSDERALRDLIKTWLAASKAGDTATVLKLMAEDVVFLVPGQPPMRGRAAFAASSAQMREIELDGQSEVQEIQVFGDWAYVWTKLAVSATPKKGGATVKRAGNTLSILRKHAGGWVIFRDANLLALVPQ